MKKKGVLITATISMLIVASLMFTGCSLFSKTWKYLTAYFKSDSKALYVREFDSDENEVVNREIKVSNDILHEYAIESNRIINNYFTFDGPNSIIYYTDKYGGWTAQVISKENMLDLLGFDFEFDSMLTFFNKMFYFQSGSESVLKASMMVIEKMSEKNEDGWYVGKSESMAEYISFKIDNKEMIFKASGDIGTNATLATFVYDIDAFTIPQEALDAYRIN